MGFVAQLIKQFQAGQQVDLVAEVVLFFCRATGNTHQMEHHINAVGQYPTHQGQIRHAAEMTTKTGIFRQALQVFVQYQQRVDGLPSQAAQRQ
ncbi:hypothetical protein D3C80_1913450 [compost metagenome]